MSLISNESVIMKKIQINSTPLLIVLFVFFFQSVQAQFWNTLGEKGSGNVVSEQRDVANFNKIQAAAGIDVYFSIGDKNVKVVADDNLIEYIKTEVKDGRLYIGRTKNKTFRKVTKTEVYVSAPELVEAKATSGADFEAKGIIKAKSFIASSSSGADLEIQLDVNTLEASASSGADLEIKVTANAIDASASSGGEVSLSGTSKTATLSASSGANIDAYKLTVEDCISNASSAGSIHVTVTQSLNGKASSGGDVRYKGNPAKVDRTESSGGDVSGL